MNPKRIFMPGSDCIYLKIYTGKRMSDELLLKVVKPIIASLKKSNYINKWFFIRYGDPDFHIRIRLFVTDRMLFGDIIYTFYKQLLRWKNDNYLYKLQIDTYARELERYRGVLIEESEELFYTDSECILSIISQLNKNENYRWMIAVKLIDSLFQDFDLNLHQKQVLIDQTSRNFKHEFGFNLYNSKQFNSINRIQRKTVESILTSQILDPEFCKLYRYVNKRTKESNIFIERIKNKTANTYSTELDMLLNSYIHMTMNRLFPDSARMHELIIYDMINRFYISALAKERYSNCNKLI